MKNAFLEIRAEWEKVCFKVSNVSTPDVIINLLRSWVPFMFTGYFKF